MHGHGRVGPLIRLVCDLERIRRPGAPILQSVARAQALEILAVEIHRADIREAIADAREDDAAGPGARPRLEPQAARSSGSARQAAVRRKGVMG